MLATTNPSWLPLKLLVPASLCPSQEGKDLAILCTFLIPHNTASILSHCLLQQAHVAAEKNMLPLQLLKHSCVSP